MDLTATSDEALAALAKNGDARAFALLLERHYDFLYRVAYRWCGVKADAEDAAQNVCMRLGKSIQSWRGNGAFRTWLYALALNAVRDLGRRARSESAKAEAWRAEVVDCADHPDASQEEAAASLWHAVRRLPDRQRDAVLLIYGEDLSHAEAANVMAISETTVSWHIHEAKKRLRVLMREAREV